MDELVVGVDAGGTAVRAVAATVSGHVVGRGTAGGANHRSNGDGAVVASLTTALRGALCGVDGARVRRTVVGMAGAGAAGADHARDLLARAAGAVGLRGQVDLVPDLVVAFASGAAGPEGHVLVAGTGAVAAAVRDGEVLHRADGYGWLAGDEGSAVWQGRAALRAVLRALDGRGPATALTDRIGTVVAEPWPDGDGDGDPAGGCAIAERRAQALVAWGFATPASGLGRLGPLVRDAAAAGDPVAAGICAAAAERLLVSLRAVRSATATAVGAGAPVVLAGSVLLAAGPVADRVAEQVRCETGASPVRGGDGAGGAAALAAARHTGRPVPPGVHARLTGALGPGRP